MRAGENGRGPVWLCQGRSREGFNVSAWLGVLYPAGTPRDLVAKTSAALAKIVQSPDIAKKYAALGASQRYAGPAEFRGFLQAEYQRWGVIVKASGAKVD